MKNKYPGNCVVCSKRVESGGGHYEKVNSKENLLHRSKKTIWVVRCKNCVGMKMGVKMVMYLFALIMVIAYTSLRVMEYRE